VGLADLSFPDIELRVPRVIFDGELLQRISRRRCFSGSTP
jgi:hypothetical protein